MEKEQKSSSEASSVDRQPSHFDESELSSLTHLFSGFGRRDAQCDR